MANTVTINSADELRTYKATILSNLAKSVWDISAIIERPANKSQVEISENLQRKMGTPI